MARIPTAGTPTDEEALDEIRRVEDALRRHGFDPARAIEQRDDPESRERVIGSLLETAEQVLPPDEMARLRHEIGRS